MSSKLPRKAVIAVSSFNGAIYPAGHKTGVFFVEALHPYEVLTAAGFEVDLASETETCAFDDISLTPPFLSGSEHAILNNPKHPFMVKIKSQLKKASELKKEDYGFFFASAGHAALYDYPTAKGLQAIAARYPAVSAGFSRTDFSWLVLGQLQRLERSHGARCSGQNLPYPQDVHVRPDQRIYRPVASGRSCRQGCDEVLIADGAILLRRFSS